MVVLFLKSFQTIWCQEDTFFNRDKMVSPEVMVSKPVMVEKPVLLETQYGASEEAPCIYENTRDLSVPQGIIGSQFS